MCCSCDVVAWEDGEEFPDAGFIGGHDAAEEGLIVGGAIRAFGFAVGKLGHIWVYPVKLSRCPPRSVPGGEVGIGFLNCDVSINSNERGERLTVHKSRCQSPQHRC